MNSATRNFLRKRAHHLNPVVMVGRQGADERILRALDEALLAHELVKVRFQDFHNEIRSITERLADSVGSDVVSIVGHIAILYRQHPEASERTIHIPKNLVEREG